MDGRRAPLFAIIPPPVVYAATFLVGWGVSRLLVWSPAWIETPAARWAGLALLILGLALAAVAAGLFASRRTTFNPADIRRRLLKPASMPGRATPCMSH